ncbi:MAG: hypothetical protein WC610_03610 [Patescibacteria group bacterium]
MSEPQETFDIPIFLVRLFLKQKPRSRQMQWECELPYRGYIFKFVANGDLKLNSQEYYFIQARHILYRNLNHRFLIVAVDLLRKLELPDEATDEFTLFFSPPENHEKAQGRWEAIYYGADMTIKFVPENNRNNPQPSPEQAIWHCSVSGLLHYSQENHFAIVAVNLLEPIEAGTVLREE